MNTRNTGFTIIELMVGVLIGSFVVIGALRFLKSSVNSSKGAFTSSTLDTELSRFEQLMFSDLARAGNDPTGVALVGYQYVSGQSCSRQEFLYGLIKNPTNQLCNQTLGQIGILSYQGVDVNRDGVFFPEEGISFNNPTLRPPAPVGLVPTPPNPLPINFYNDFIVYEWVAQDVLNGSIVRKNLGSLDSLVGDYSETALRNVVQFNVTFESTRDLGAGVEEGTGFDKVTVLVTVREANADPNYANPAYTSSSPIYLYRTQSRTFTFNVIKSALSVN